MKTTNSSVRPDELERFLLRSQFRAALAVAAFCGLLIVIQIVIITTALQPSTPVSHFHHLRLFLLPLLVGAVALIELGYARSIHVHFRGGRMPHRLLPFAISTGEALLPTTGIILLSFASDWSTALYSPPVSGYFIILMLSILRMDMRICLFIGTVQALSFLILITIAPNPPGIGFLLGIVILILIASTIAAGIVRVTRGLVTDLIASHQAEAEATYAQKQAEATIWQKDRLLATLSHDLRAPLNGISTLSELIARVPEQFTASEIRGHAHEIQQISRHLRELLDNLLTWAQLRTSQLPVSPAHHSARDLVEPVLMLFELAFSMKSIHLSSSLTGHVTTDRDLFQTILRNLLSNALKFTPSGGSVTVTASNESDGFTLSVTDNGPGLPDEIVQQAAGGTCVTSSPGTAGETGSGFGLLLSHELTQCLGGTLTFEPSPKATEALEAESGLTARLHLPLSQPSETRV